MKWICYMLLMGSALVCKAQDFSASYVDLLTKELRTFPYRDLALSYSLLYDSLQNRYVFQAQDLYDEDTVAHARLTRKLNELPRTTTHSYIGSIKFDNYTDTIFISSEALGGDKIYTAIEILMEPRGGIERFVARWGSFLDSLKTIGEFDERNVSPRSYVHLIVDIDGSLVCPDSSEGGMFLREFIRKERPWSPGIMSGRPILQRVDLQVPSFGIDYRALSYKRYFGFSGFMNGKKLVYYSRTLPKQKEVRSIISAVYTDHGYVVPVFHRGPVDELQQLMQFLTEGRVRTIAGNSMFSRTYFYTLGN